MQSLTVINTSPQTIETLTTYIKVFSSFRFTTFVHKNENSCFLILYDKYMIIQKDS